MNNVTRPGRSNDDSLGDKGRAGKSSRGPSDPSGVAVFRLFYTFLPETSLFRQVRFQLVAVSRFLSEAGQQGLFYAALVAVAGDPFQASLIGAAKAAPAAALGLIGGIVADALPRRVAMGFGYAAQAAACVLVATLLGTGFVPLLLLVACVSALNQLIEPSEKSVIPLMTKKAQIASAAAALAVADSMGDGVGRGFLAPILLKTVGIRPVLFACSAVLALAAIRVFSLPLQRNISVKEALHRLRLSEAHIGLQSALDWLLGWPAVATMITAGVVVSVMSVSWNTLQPSYVGSALDANPADAVYVFAPSGFAALVALVIGPKIVDKMGERWLAAAAIFVFAAALFALAFIDQLTPIIAPLNPVNIVRLFGAHPSKAILAASMITIVTGFAASLSSFAVQTYLNRRVPAVLQGRTFGLQSVLSSGVAIIPLIAFGAIAQLTSVKAILFWAPWLAVAMIYGLLVIASRMTGRERPRAGEVMASFWHEPTPATEMPEATQ